MSNNDAAARLNQLSDRLQDTKGANAILYLIAAAIGHSEGTHEDYSDALILLYEILSAQIADQQSLIGEISEIIKSNRKGW